MTSADPLDVTRASKPEDITEPVNYRFDFGSFIVFSTLIGFAVFLLALLVLLTISVLWLVPIDTKTLAVAAVLGVISAVYVALDSKRRYGTTELVIDSFGITSRKDRVVMQRCPWDALTVTKSGKRGYVYADQNRISFPFKNLSSRDPLQSLASQVMYDQTEKQRKEFTQMKRFNLKRAMLFSLGVAAIGFTSLHFFPLQWQPFIDSVGDPQVQPSTRSYLLFIAVLRVIPALGVYGVLVAFALGAGWLADLLSKRTDTGKFISSRNPFLVPARLEEGKWYRYSDAKMIRFNDPLINLEVITGLLFVVICAACFLFSTGVPASDRLKVVGPILGICLVGIAAISAVVLPNAIPIRRAIQLHLRQVSKTYELRLNDGSIVTANERIVPRTDRPQHPNIGMLTWKFNASDGKTYSFDPRFLVEVDDSEPGTSETKSQ